MSERVRACGNCKFLSRETESWEMSHIYWYECSARPQVENLKSFPFRKTKCTKFEERSRPKEEPSDGEWDAKKFRLLGKLDAREHVDSFVDKKGEEKMEETKTPEEIAIMETKSFRHMLDNTLQEIKESPYTSRERSLAVTKLQEAIMWLGMDLKSLGTPNPYPNSYNAENTIVDPTADGLKL